MKSMARTRAAAIAALAFCAIASAQFGAPRDLLTLKVVPEFDGAAPGGELAVAVAVNVKDGWHINAHKPLEEFLIPTVISIEAIDTFRVESITYPEAETKSFSFSDSPVAVYEGEVLMRVRLRITGDAAPGTITLKGKLGYQACDDKQCMAPASAPFEVPIRVLAPGETASAQDPDLFARLAERLAGVEAAQPPDHGAVMPVPSPAPVATGEGDWKTRIERFEIIGEAGGLMNAEEFIAFIDAAESGQGYSQGFEGKGAWAIAGLTLLGGLALNLTPCVLPLIPINLAIIGAGVKAGSRARGFALGGMYGAGMALLYGALGLVVVFGFGSFGAVNASPWFNFGIAAIFIVLALAMFDVILIDFTKFQSKLGIQKDSGNFLFAFFMGAVNALLAGACVAPVVIAVILYAQNAYANGSRIALGLPFLLGVGMALPWPFAGGGLSMLPKPGMWMVRVKQAFGVFILVFAAYYVYMGYRLYSDRNVDPNTVLASINANTEHGWLRSLDAALEQAEREKKPILIDFWATWCKNCLVMNETTFKDPKVLARLDSFVKLKYQAERPDDPPAKDLLSRFNGYVGLPYFAVLKPKTAG